MAIYKPDFITQEFHDRLVECINSQPWCHDLKRLTQHYGYKYDYRNRAITQSDQTTPMPEPIAELGKMLFDNQLIPSIPDQAIVNRYLPGEGIAPHIDCTTCFTDYVASVSLLCGITMLLKPQWDGAIIRKYYLEPRSVIVLHGRDRYEATHEIEPVKYEGVWNGIAYEKKPRSTRLSITFRNVILSNKV